MLIEYRKKKIEGFIYIAFFYQSSRKAMVFLFTIQRFFVEILTLKFPYKIFTTSGKNNIYSLFL